MTALAEPKENLKRTGSADECFALLLVGAGLPGQKAQQVIQQRVEKGEWPIYLRTRNQKEMVPGKRVMFYVAGSGPSSQCVIGSAVIASVAGGSAALSLEIGASVTMRLILKEGRMFDAPVDVKARRGQLSFLRLKGKFWYTSLQGGSARMTRADWDLLHP